ncbi:MAG: hypothetical protein QM635_12280, partial [Microbacteriaceae bacterium]
PVPAPPSPRTAPGRRARPPRHIEHSYSDDVGVSRPENGPGDVPDGSSGGLIPDETLIRRTRAGDRQAFGELWRRHCHTGIAAARSFSRLAADDLASVDLASDDLVSEAFTRVHKRTVDGGGPGGAFRPYLLHDGAEHRLLGD